MVDNASVGQMLAQKGVSNLDEIAQLAVADAQVLRTILDGLVAKDDTYRYNCFQVLHQVSQNEPRTLYPEWDYFIQLLGSQNAYHRAISVQILANLTRIDAEQRFDALFDRYFALSTGHFSQGRPTGYEMHNFLSQITRINEFHECFSERIRAICVFVPFVFQKLYGRETSHCSTTTR
jgi:hypothetical protein